MKITLWLGLGFMVSIQPLMMISMLLGMVVLYSLDVYYESMSFWFGYILMLIVLSGVLVVFTYIISLVPNESFEYFLGLVVVIGSLGILMEKEFFMSGNQSLFSVLLWEGVMSGFLIFLGIFLLGIMIMVNFLGSAVDGAFRVFLYAW